MTFKPKLWLGVGAVALAGTASPTLADPAHPIYPEGSESRASATHTFQKVPVRLAQAGGEGGEGGEGGSAAVPQGGEGGERGASRAPGRSLQHVAPRKRGHRGEERHPGRAGRREHRGEVGNGFRLRGASGPGGGGGERGMTRLAGPGGEGGEGGVNTRYIFGFTEGADTERAGEKEIENDTVARLTKRAGSYTAVQNKTELEFGVTDNLMVEFGGFLSYHRILQVPDLDDRQTTKFDGTFAEAKYRLLDRRTSPFGLAISAEPEWHRFSGTSGRYENSYAVELKLYGDAELVPNKLFFAANLLYEPEVVHVKETDEETGRFKEWERESTFGISGAISAAVTDSLFLGGEVRYLSKFEGAALNKLEGSAVFVGPTLSAKIAPNARLQAAYSIQVLGEAVDEPHRKLDLDHFERHQARLRLVVEF